MRRGSAAVVIISAYSPGSMASPGGETGEFNIEVPAQPADETMTESTAEEKPPAASAKPHDEPKEEPKPDDSEKPDPEKAIVRHPVIDSSEFASEMLDESIEEFSEEPSTGGGAPEPQLATRVVRSKDAPEKLFEPTPFAGKGNATSPPSALPSPGRRPQRAEKLAEQETPSDPQDNTGPLKRGSIASSPSVAVRIVIEAGAMGDDLPKKLAVNAPPPYPPDAWQAGIEGRVVLKAKIDVDGTVDDISVETSSGHKSLDKAALDAVKRWKFEPARRFGRAIVYEVAVPVRFSIRGR